MSPWPDSAPGPTSALHGQPWLANQRTCQIVTEYDGQILRRITRDIEGEHRETTGPPRLNDTANQAPSTSSGSARIDGHDTSRWSEPIDRSLFRRRRRPQNIEQFGGTRRPLVRILLETPLDQPLYAPPECPLGDPQAVCARSDSWAEMILCRRAREWWSAREDFVRHASERIDVGAMIRRRIADRLLGRHVGRRSNRGAAVRDRPDARFGCGSRDGLRNAEVGDHRGVTGEQHVVRLDVAMNDILLVGVRQRARDVAQNAHALGDAEPTLALEPRAKRFALLERHDEVQHLVHVARVVERHDVGMPQPRGDSDFAKESFTRER